MNKILLLLIGTLFLVSTYTQASDLEQGLMLNPNSTAKTVQMTKVYEPVDISLPISPSSRTSVKDAPPAARSPSIDSSEPHLSPWESFTTWGKHIVGNVSIIAGLPVAAIGGILVTTYPDITSAQGQAGVALTAFGFLMNNGGQVLLDDSRKEAAEIESGIKKHTRKIVEAAELTPEEVEKLSDEFFGMSQSYQKYIGCASKTDRAIGKILSAIGPACAASGAVLTLIHDIAVGPILAISGTAGFTIGLALKKRSEAYEAQMRRFEQVELAQVKARERLRTNSGNKGSLLPLPTVESKLGSDDNV